MVSIFQTMVSPPSAPVSKHCRMCTTLASLLLLKINVAKDFFALFHHIWDIKKSNSEQFRIFPTSLSSNNGAGIVRVLQCKAAAAEGALIKVWNHPNSSSRIVWDLLKCKTTNLDGFKLCLTLLLMWFPCTAECAQLWYNWYKKNHPYQIRIFPTSLSSAGGADVVWVLQF